MANIRRVKLVGNFPANLFDLALRKASLARCIDHVPGRWRSVPHLVVP
jgi:hypothetical protein